MGVAKGRELPGGCVVPVEKKDREDSVVPKARVVVKVDSVARREAKEEPRKVDLRVDLRVDLDLKADLKADLRVGCAAVRAA